MDREIAILLAERDINAVMQRYCHTMDMGDEAGWVACFTDTAVFDVRNFAGELIHREDGRGDLERYIAQYPKPPRFRRHLYTSALLDVDVEAGTATGENYWTFFVCEPGEKPGVVAFGRSSDKYVREAGGWKIAERYAIADGV